MWLLCLFFVSNILNLWANMFGSHITRAIKWIRHNDHTQFSRRIHFFHLFLLLLCEVRHDEWKAWQIKYKKQYNLFVQRCTYSLLNFFNQKYEFSSTKTWKEQWTCMSAWPIVSNEKANRIQCVERQLQFSVENLHSTYTSRQPNAHIYCVTLGLWVLMLMYLHCLYIFFSQLFVVYFVFSFR